MPLGRRRCCTGVNALIHFFDSGIGMLWEPVDLIADPAVQSKSLAALGK
jgi:hypothetical protein